MRAFCAVLGMALPVCLHADINSPIAPPPQPVPVTVQTLPGEKVEITLKGRSRSGLPLKFLIRTPPSSGTLSEPQSDGNYSAMIVYQPDPSSKARSDFFMYAVQAPNTGVSAPERVSIRIIEPASQFEGPTSAAFGGVFLGESESRKITLANNGGGIIKGKIIPPPPWTISDEGAYVLIAGKSKEFTLTFAPTDAREYREVAAYTHDPLLRLSLYGEGLQPIRILTKKLSLQRNANGGREGEISIANISQKPQAVTFQTPEHLSPVPAVDIAPGKTKKIAVHVAPKYLDAVDGEIGVQCGAFTTKIPVSAFAVPPKLSFSADKKLDFGEITPGRVFRKPLSITNTGGTSATLQVVAPDEITIQPGLAKTPIPPGKTVSFEVVFEPGSGTKPPMDIIFMRGEREVHRMPLAFVLKTNRIDLSRIGISAPSPQSPTQPSSAGTPAEQKAAEPAPVIDRIWIVEQRASSFKILWKKPADNAFMDYTLEGRTAGKRPDGKPELIWARLRSVQVTSDDKYFYATVTGLPRGSALTYRIVGKDKSGTYQPLSGGFTVSTKHGTPFRIPLAPILIAVFLVVAFFVWRNRKKRKEEMQREMTRTRRIL